MSGSGGGLTLSIIPGSAGPVRAADSGLFARRLPDSLIQSPRPSFRGSRSVRYFFSRQKIFVETRALIF
jgi:hypothetical protein